jgi:teichuronic acid biosynthesis glycosyltransferase TuaG
MKRKLSVIIPFYKEIDLISRAVLSIFSQSQNDWEFEVIVINDGPFKEADITKAIGADNVTVIANKQNKGPGGARNTGLDLASGDLIAFLDADDFWLDGKIASQLLAVSENANFICTGYRFESGNAVVNPPTSISKSIDIFLKQGVGTSTVLLTKKLLGSTRFNDYRFSQDIDFWYRLAEKTEFKYLSIQEPLVFYYTGGSTKNKVTQAKSLMNVLNKNRISLMLKVYIMTRYFIRGVYNHYLRG